MPFVCPECGDSHRHRQSLRQHVRAKHEKITYPCPECPSKEYKRKTDLNTHMKEFHGDETRERLPCPIPGCEETFSKKSNRTRHLKKQHLGASEDEIPENDHVEPVNEIRHTNDARDGDDIESSDASGDGSALDNDRAKHQEDLALRGGFEGHDGERTTPSKDRGSETMAAAQSPSVRGVKSTPDSSVLSNEPDQGLDVDMLDEEWEMSEDPLNNTGSWTDAPLDRSLDMKEGPGVKLVPEFSIAPSGLKTKEAALITLTTERAAKTTPEIGESPELPFDEEYQRLARLKRYMADHDGYMVSSTFWPGDDTEMTSNASS